MINLNHSLLKEKINLREKNSYWKCVFLKKL